MPRRGVALLDVREEAIHAEGHPLFAANLPLLRLELEVYERVPRKETVETFRTNSGPRAVAQTS